LGSFSHPRRGRIWRVGKLGSATKGNATLVQPVP
jgi:hypothetical protein